MEYDYYFDILNGKNKDNLKIILHEILAVFEKIGLDFDCKPINIQYQNKGYPQFCLVKENPGLEKDTICLTVSDYSYWCQTVYQLSHELTHCFIHCHNMDKRYYSSWVEETICEAVSLYFLAYFRDNWANTQLYPYNPKYSESFAQYHKGVELKDGNNRLSNCRGYDNLMDIERTSQDKREDRKNEMLDLYPLISERNIKGLIYYRDFVIKDSKILDTENYITAYPDNMAVNYLCELQDKILRSDGDTKVA